MMIYFSREWVDEVILPDGTAATSAADVDRYMRQNNVVLSADYSADFYRNVKQKKQRRERQELFAEFIKAYKRSVWNNGTNQ